MAPSRPPKLDISNVRSGEVDSYDAALRSATTGGRDLSEFLVYLFSNAPEGRADPRAVSKHWKRLVDDFLQGRTAYSIEHCVQLMYSNTKAQPPKRNNSANRTAHEAQVTDPNYPFLASVRLDQWAVEHARQLVWTEGALLSSKKGGFHSESSKETWDYIEEISFKALLNDIQSKAPVTLRLISAAAGAICDERDTILHPPLPQPMRSSTDREDAKEAEDAREKILYSSFLPDAAPDHPGSGNNPFVSLYCIVVVILMLMNARNHLCSVFQKLVGVFLFAQQASRSTVDFLCRIGLSVAPTTTRAYLEALGDSANETIRYLASLIPFRVMFIYDNINRTTYVWDPLLGQGNQLKSGTAQLMLVLFENPSYTPDHFKIGLDPKPLEEARAQNLRKQLSVKTLDKRLPEDGMLPDWAIQALAMLADHVGDPLKPVSAWAEQQFADGGPRAKRRQRARKTEFHMMETTDFNEADPGDNAKLLEHLLIHKCGLSKAQVEKLLGIVGGDQSTAEKQRAMKKFLADCPHGFARFGWVLPLIQLWHMGWADIERILKTHWGNRSDPSSFRVLNSWLKRNVKLTKRPDYYSALHLILDSLRGDILECWRIMLGTTNLREHFKALDPAQATPEVLIETAKKLVEHYLTPEARDIALQGGPDAEAFFGSSEAWTRKSHVPGRTGEPGQAGTGKKKAKKKTAAEKRRDELREKAGSRKEPFKGDLSLANRIQRMRDSMLHYSFQTAVADGDIGRVVDVMSVWQFTFAGSNKHKYTNELLELVCGFEFEFSEQLQDIILDNWLVNLTGLDGHWFPGDLLVEKHIKQLKQMAQRSDVDFGDEFFRKIIALNIRHLLDASNHLRNAVGLADRSQSHRPKNQEIAMNELQRRFKQQKTHIFQPGRALAFRAADDFTTGYLSLAANNEQRLRDFVERTSRDFGTLNASEDGTDDDEGDESPLARAGDGVEPNQMANGVLVIGDEVVQDM